MWRIGKIVAKASRHCRQFLQRAFISFSFSPSLPLQLSGLTLAENLEEVFTLSSQNLRLDLGNSSLSGQVAMSNRDVHGHLLLHFANNDDDLLKNWRLLILAVRSCFCLPSYNLAGSSSETIFWGQYCKAVCVSETST